jgi:hypothetical protein
MNSYLDPMKAHEPTWAESSIIERNEHLRDVTPNHNQVYMEPMDLYGAYKPRYPVVTLPEPETDPLIETFREMQKEKEREIEMMVAESARRNKEMAESVMEMQRERERELEIECERLLSDKPLIDPVTGVVNEDVARRQADDALLHQRISAGADGGMGDNVGGPCQESFRNLADKLYPVRKR